MINVESTFQFNLRLEALMGVRSLTLGFAMLIALSSPLIAQDMGDCSMCGDDPDQVGGTGDMCTIYTSEGQAWCAQDWIEEPGGEYYCYTSLEDCEGGATNEDVDFVLARAPELSRGSAVLSAGTIDWPSAFIFTGFSCSPPEPPRAAQPD